ncbi:MAG: hypothetical protein DMG05_30815, partial [Acidobacteria bacterium]
MHPESRQPVDKELFPVATGIPACRGPSGTQKLPCSRTVDRQEYLSLPDIDKGFYKASLKRLRFRVATRRRDSKIEREDGFSLFQIFVTARKEKKEMSTIEKWSKRRVGMASIGARVVGVSLVLSVFLWTYSIAQETSTIQGHIADSSGASVPKAQVKATGVSRTALSADDGYYRIVDLLAGSYQVRVEVSGFKTIVKSGVQLSARAITGLNFTLEVGEVSQTVDVTSEEPQVETQIARITEVISETEIKSLPLQGRGVLNVAYMTPGITGKPVGGDSGSFVNLWCCDAMSQTGAPNISSGGRENKGNFTLDGINMRYTEGSSWGMLFTPNE